MWLSMAIAAAMAWGDCWWNASYRLPGKGRTFVSLEVRHSNLSAISLYRQLGFIETGRRKSYYENGEDALLMEYIFDTEKESGDAV